MHERVLVIFCVPKLLCFYVWRKKLFFATQKGEYRAISNTAAQVAEKMGRKLKKQTMEALTHMKLRGRTQPG
jgi:hypothetical protein